MTVSERDWDLIQREIDGANTDNDSDGLRERRDREPELDACYRALVDLERTLGSVELVEAPGNLAGDIMRQVRQRGTPIPGPGRLPGLKDWVTRQPLLALASSLAAGLVAGILVTAFFGGGELAPLDESVVSGTLLPPGHLAALPVVDEAPLEGPGVQGSAMTRRGPDVVLAELVVSSEGPVDVTLEVDEAGLRPRGFECLGGEPKGGVVIEAGRIELRQAPAGRCFVSLAVLRVSPGRVTFHIQAGAGRAEATLQVGTKVE